MADSTPPTTTATSGIVPIVDFSPFLHGTTADRLRTGTAIFTAFRDVGFVYLTNHGIPSDTITQAFSMSRAFFDLPLPSKQLAPHPPSAFHHRGYSSLGLEKVSLYPDSTSAPTFEAKESFDIGREQDPLTPNIWPPEDILPGFRDTNVAVFHTLQKTAIEILHALALGLGLEERFFDAYHSATEPCHQLRLLHYPAIEESVLRDGSTARIVAHTDKGTITLLLQEDDGVAGLEVGDASGGFVAAPVVPGSVLVNIGDLLQMWSNDVLKSTRHRVVAPREEQGGMVGRRFSIPYFVAVDRDVVVECLDGCWGEGREKKYEKVKAWDYIAKAMSPSY